MEVINPVDLFPGLSHWQFGVSYLIAVSSDSKAEEGRWQPQSK